MKMKDRNSQLKATLGSMPTRETIKEVASIPAEDTVNKQGYAAYSVADELRLLAMLNTLKLEPQFYRTESETMKELRELIEKLALKEPYFVAQCIVWSRCMGEGMRSINHLAAALLAPFVSGTEWGRRFYAGFNKKTKSGGCIFRMDDMSEIKDVFSALNKSKLTNAMKKGFASVLVNADTYNLCKYKKATIDISNLVHPDIEAAKATVNVDGKEMKVIDALMRGITISADTWETANSDAGQEVAKAVKEGRLSKEKAAEVLKEAKNDNWESLLKDGKLGILAAIRNLRNMLQGARQEVIDAVCTLVQDGDKIRKGLVMPYQLEFASEAVRQSSITSSQQRQVTVALDKGMLAALPNLKNICTGRNLIAIDCSGSMNTVAHGSRSSCSAKAGIMAAMLAKGVNADVIRFGGSSQFVSYNPNDSLSTLADQFGRANMGWTNIASVFELITRQNKVYDRIFILSDNEANHGTVSAAYKEYIRKAASPYVYAIDLAAYGTAPLKNDGKVNYFFGYGYACFDSIAQKEFNPQMHIDKVRQVVI